MSKSVHTILGDVLISSGAAKCDNKSLDRLVQSIIADDSGAYANSEVNPDVDAALYDVIVQGLPPPLVDISHFKSRVAPH